MNEKDPPDPICLPPQPAPDRVCDECGAPGAFQFADVNLCVDCYAGRGSCCPEFGKDDLWTYRSDRPAGK